MLAARLLPSLAFLSLTAPSLHGQVGFQFVPVSPCRVMDTRGANGTFGGPSIAGGATRSVSVPQSACNIPATAQAYSLNVTVVPPGSLTYLSIWPTGEPQPVVSTLNSLDGRIVANAAIVPAGTNGAISVYVSNTTDVIIDINGYFAPASTSGSMPFYSTTPCRVADTRNASGPFGGPFMRGGSTRSFDIPSSSCGIPDTAQAYSLNITVVPHESLGYLTAWPTGESQPVVSTLNSLDGSIVANAAIVPEGTSGAVSVYVTNDTDVIIDINGYFAPASTQSGSMSFYTTTPCRAVDTRAGQGFTGQFGPPSMAAGSTRSFAIPASACNIPAGAQAYSLNITVVPPAALGYLTAWPTGQTQPYVSTLNSPNGAILANASIVPAGTNGNVSVYVTDATDLVIDIDGYFAPASTQSGIPTITSITPPYGSTGRTLTGVVIQGTSLSGATFNLQGGGTVTVTNSASTQATVNIVVGSTPGVYTLLATGSGGTSSSTPTTGNTFEVYPYAPGNNYTTLLFSVFNANGTSPNYPAGSNKADLSFSVFNAMGTTPNYPAGSNGADLSFSVFNATGTAQNYPAGSNGAAELFSVFNPLVTPGTTTLIPPGSNWAFQLFSTQNQSSAVTGLLSLSVAPLAERIDFGAAAGVGATASVANTAGQAITLLAGQTVTITLQPSLLMTYLEIDAEGAALASSAISPLSAPFTAPSGAATVDLTAFGYTNTGTTSTAPVRTVQISSDPGRTITGRVVDASGTPVAGARVTWNAQGLAAEYYTFDHDLSAIPDLVGARPTRLSFLGALNYPNPNRIFGLDPMGVGMGENYAARFRGKIQVETAGRYQFLLRAHAGARLKIDGEVVAEAVALGADSADADGTANLTAGKHDIEVIHFESGGSAGLQLLWTPPGGLQQIVPPAIISADAPAAEWRAVTGRDGRFVLRAPAALDGVIVKLVTGTGLIEIDR